MDVERIPVTRILAVKHPAEVAGLVYLLRCQVYTKIGRAETLVKARKSACQTGSPFKITLLGEYKVAAYGRVEKNLHSVFRDKRVRGEWFKLNAEDLVWVTAHLTELAEKISHQPNA